MKTLDYSKTNSLSHTEINNNPLNNSTSKMQFSFSKSRRFKSENKLLVHAPYYDVTPVKETRTATFGLGNKLTFQDRRVVPASNTYKIEGDFEPEKSKKKGFSFGVGRQKAKSTFFRGSDAPGPGAYNPEIKPHPLSALMMGKVKDHSLDQKIKVPGPGEYNQRMLNMKDKAIQSKHSNPRFPVILKGQRSKTQKSQTPSPWAYNPVLSTPNKQLSSSRFGKFSTTKKLAIYRINDTPGPGYYNRFSEFS